MEEQVEFRGRSESAHVASRDVKKVGRADKKFILDDLQTKTGGNSRTKSEYSQDRSLIMDETIDELQSNKRSAVKRKEYDTKEEI